eukprot:674523_1
MDGAGTTKATTLRKYKTYYQWNARKDRAKSFLRHIYVWANAERMEKERQHMSQRQNITIVEKNVAAGLRLLDDEPFEPEYVSELINCVKRKDGYLPQQSTAPTIMTIVHHLMTQKLVQY